VFNARADASEPFRPVTAEQLAAFDQASFGGFHGDGPVVRCSFFVRAAEAVWGSRNLPEGNITQEDVDGGVRFIVETTAVTVVARFVAGLGGAARPETPQLAELVAAIAREALANATAGPG
jgi:WYL domain